MVMVMTGCAPLVSAAGTAGDYRAGQGVDDSRAAANNDKRRQGYTPVFFVGVTSSAGRKYKVASGLRINLAFSANAMLILLISGGAVHDNGSWCWLPLPLPLFGGSTASWTGCG